MTKVKNSSRTIEFMITLLDANRHVLQTHSGIKGTFFTLKNLQQNRTYILMLQARNIAGYGQAANVTVKTLEAGKALKNHSRLICQCVVSLTFFCLDRSLMHEVTGPSIVWLFICFDRTHHTVILFFLIHYHSLQSHFITISFHFHSDSYSLTPWVSHSNG